MRVAKQVATSLVVPVKGMARLGTVCPGGRVGGREFPMLKDVICCSNGPVGDVVSFSNC